ncbi:hypothetical protein ACLKA6_016084 [Drosophila palustris]
MLCAGGCCVTFQCHANWANVFVWFEGRRGQGFCLPHCVAVENRKFKCSFRHVGDADDVALYSVPSLRKSPATCSIQINVTQHAENSGLCQGQPVEKEEAGRSELEFVAMVSICFKL